MEKFLKSSFVLLSAALLVASGFFIANSALATGGTVMVTASNPTVSVSTDAISGSSVSVGTITMVEDNSGVFHGTSGSPETVTLTPPPGFTFDATSVADVQIIGDSTSGNNINNATSGTHFSASTSASLITFNITAQSVNNKAGTLIWSNIKVKPISGSPLASGSISIGGTSVSAPNSYGNTNPILLTEVAGSPSANTSTFICSPTTGIIAGGSTSCTATVKDAFSNPISGASVNLVASGTDNHFNHNPSSTDAGGQATFEVRSNTAQTETITATINGSLSLTPVSVTFIAAGAAIGTIHADTTTPEASLAPGTPVNLTITVTDSYGNPVNNYSIDLRVGFASHIDSLGSALISGSGVTQGSGQTTRTLTGINVGTATLSFNGLIAAGDTTIHFQDTTKPVITINDGNPVSVEFRTPYTDAGATAADNIDGNITANIHTVNPVNTNTVMFNPAHDGKIVATYTVTYDVDDSSSNHADQKTRTVNVVDSTAPVISSITSNATTTGVLKIGNTITFTLTPTLAEPIATVSGSYNGQTLAWSTSNAGVTYTATYTVTEGDADQTLPLQITGVTMIDEAGNVSSPGLGMDVRKTIDAHRPLVSIVDSDEQTFNLATVSPHTIKITFNENISNTPSVSVHSVVGAQTVNNCGDTDAKTFCFNYTIPIPQDRTSHSVLISGAQDMAGNTMAPISDNSHAFIVDTVAPALTEKTPVTNPTNSSTPNYLFTTTEPGAMTYGGACSGFPVSASFGDNLVTFNHLEDGTYSNCTILVTDAAGNSSNTLLVSSFTIDTSRPTLHLSTTASNPTNQKPIHVTATFSEPVTGFEIGDISVGNGTAGNFAAVEGGTIYTFDITPNGDDPIVDNITVDVAADVAHDPAGNGNNATATLSIVYDTVQPTVTLVELKEGGVTSDGLVKSGNILTVIATFSEDMAASPAPQISISGANTLSNTDMTRVDATHYTYDFTAGSGDGTATITILNGQDLAGNTQVSNSNTTFTVDNTLPVIDQHDNITDTANATGGKTITYEASASDSHDGPIVPICSPASGSFFPLGTTTVTCNATDQAGNAAVPTTFTVTVNPDVITHIIFTASPTELAFSDKSLLTVTGKDQYNNVVTNNNSSVVVLSADGGGSLDNTILTLALGVATTNLSKDSAGAVHVTASCDSLTPQQVTVVFDETDTTSPYVQSHTPDSNATNVAVTVHPVLVFSEPLNTITVSSLNIQLKKYSDDSTIPASISSAEGDRQVIITPISPLDFSTQYYFVVLAGVTDKVGNPAVPYGKGDDGNSFTTIADNTVLTVNGISAIKTYATADGTYEHGWSWTFNVTAPIAETDLQMKFSDWTSVLLHTIPAAGNIRYSSSQSSNGPIEVESNDYGDPLHLTSDLDPSAPGRQIHILVEARIPAGSAGGSYTTSYGIKTTAPESSPD